MNRLFILLLFVNLIFPRKTIVKIGTLAPEGTAWHDILLELGQKWKIASNGDVQLRIYPGGILGDERDMVRKMRIGQIQAVALSTEGLSELAPEFNSFFLPLAYQSFEDIDKVLEAMLPDLQKQMQESRAKLLYVTESSWAYWFSTEPIIVPEDLKDRKIFTWAGNHAYENVYKKAGYSVVPLAGTELLSGLQTGLINTIPTVPLYALARQTFGIADYMLNMKWGVLLAGFVIDDRTWNRIPKKYHKEFIEILNEVKKKSKSINRDSENKAIEAMKGYGLKVIEPDPDQVEKWMNEATRIGPLIRGNTMKSNTYDKVIDILYKNSPQQSK